MHATAEIPVRHPIGKAVARADRRAISRNVGRAQMKTPNR